MIIRDANGNIVPVETITGADGRKVELRATATYIQWRYEDLEWQNLVSLEDITGAQGDPGADGEEVQLRIYGTLLQWRLGNTGTWQTLLDIAAYATIRIGAVTTLPAGSAATVSNTGTTQQAVLNFGIPQGIQGVPGEAAAHAASHATGGNDFVSPSSIGAATTTNYTATIGTTWTSADDWYTQDITVAGLLATDHPKIDLVTSSTLATAKLEQAAYSKILRMVASANTLTVYSTAATTQSMNIQMEVVR